MFSIGDLFAVLVTWIGAILLVSLKFIVRIVGLLFLPAVLWFGLSFAPIDLALRILIYLFVLGIAIILFPRGSPFAGRYFSLRVSWLPGLVIEAV